ncbi:MAG: ASCH domain-containing protein [Bacteroidota bacterium]
MRYITLVVIALLVGCKGKKNSEPIIDGTVSSVWGNFIKSNPEYTGEAMPESWFFHDNEKDADRLAALTVQAKKQASSGLYYWYEQAGADLPKIGTKHIVTDFKGNAKAIIVVKKVDTIPFHQISEEYAILDMGTNKEPLKKWKKAHWDFFSKSMIENGETPTEDMLVVCEWFETIWPMKE